jgi:pimeloyl-ACP methyl ester carboxylesterase
MENPVVAAPEKIPFSHPDYPFASHFVSLPAGRMHYVDEGEGETLLFVHGTPTWSFEWRHIIRALSAHYRCVAPDHLGFGFSDRPRGFAYTPEAHVENLSAFARELDLRDVTLVVHDFGGPIGLPLCFEEPARIRRLAAINSWMWSFEGDRDMEKAARVTGGALGRFLYRHANFSLRVITPFAYGNRRKLTKDIHRQYLDRFPDAWSRGAVLWPLARALMGSSAFYRSLWDRRHRLQVLPALLLWGMKDRAFPPRILERWKQALPGARVAEVPEAGHWPHEEDPEAVLRALREFLRR